MGVSRHDRDDYEQGQADRHDHSIESVIRDTTIQHPESEAYYKGRDGEQLDEDKDDE
jgi:hypothetical protein